MAESTLSKLSRVGNADVPGKNVSYFIYFLVISFSLHYLHVNYFGSFVAEARGTAHNIPIPHPQANIPTRIRIADTNG